MYPCPVPILRCEKTHLSSSCLFLSQNICFYIKTPLVIMSINTFVSIKFCRWVAAQSVFYHLYNQVSYMSLDQISPLTFSVGNTMKRISVIVSSIIIFRTPVQPINALGAAIAILGTFLYSQVIPHNTQTLKLQIYPLL